MEIVKLKKENLTKIVNMAKKVLLADGLVVLPSDTAYGLAANACSAKAANKVYDFKGRQFAKGLSVFLNNLEEIKKYTIYSQEQWGIIRTLLPGPFTVVLKSKHKAAKAVEPDNGTLGVRIIDQALVKQITQAVTFPITATSANISGKGPHYSTASFLATLSEKKKTMVGLVIDAGVLPKRPTSTVVRLVGEEIKVLREGALNLRLFLRQETESEEETRELAQKIFKNFLFKNLKNQAVAVILKGDLGSGKTVFAQGIGEILGLQLTSPTFVLLDEYKIKTKNQKLKTKNGTTEEKK